MTIEKLIVAKVLSYLYFETQKYFKLGWLNKPTQKGSILVEFESKWHITRSCVCKNVWKSIELELHKSLKVEIVM